MPDQQLFEKVQQVRQQLNTVIRGKEEVLKLLFAALFAEGHILMEDVPGTGKTTLIKRLRKEFPTFGYSVSCTTRAPRDGEVDGRDYHFLGRERFVELRDQGHFAEWAEVHGNFYGTPLPPVREMLAKGQDILFDIDVQGAAQLRKNMPDARFLFILPPSVEELERRLRGRGLDSEEVILRRLANARAEMQEAPHYDALIVNDDLDTAYDHLRAAYLAATLAPRCRPGLVKALNNGHLL